MSISTPMSSAADRATPTPVSALTSMSPARLRVALGTPRVTPLVAISVEGDRRRSTVHLKLESGTHTGSVKDRTARALVQRHRASGRLVPGATLVESTSGNLGVSLAVFARAYEFSFVAVVDPKATPENVERMQALGARIERVDRPDGRGGYLGTRLERVAELTDALPHAVWANQYGDDANPHAHEMHTAPELLRQMDGHLDAVFVAVSTCGTLAGIGRFLRRHSPRTRIVAVDAVGSVVFGGRPATRRLVGIGSSRRPDYDIDGLFDDVVSVGDPEAFGTCRTLEASCGIAVGGSSGAVIAACARYLEDEPDLQRVLCLCPDSGVGYRSTIWADGWLLANGLSPDEIRAPAVLSRPHELLGHS